MMIRITFKLLLLTRSEDEALVFEGDVLGTVYVFSTFQLANEPLIMIHKGGCENVKLLRLTTLQFLKGITIIDSFSLCSPSTSCH